MTLQNDLLENCSSVRTTCDVHFMLLFSAYIGDNIMLFASSISKGDGDSLDLCLPAALSSAYFDV